jgi:hypothetical protein
LSLPFDKVVVATDDNPKFYEFVPIVSAAWKKFFPEVELHIAFVTDRLWNDPLVVEMERHAIVSLFPNLPGVPSGNMAKMARFFLAALFWNDVVMIEDIDTIPLQRDFFIEKTELRKPGTLLAVGRELYENTAHKGKFPISTMTAEGRVFHDLLFRGFYADTIEELIGEWKGLRVYDDKESIDHSSDPIANPDTYFSDESLMRVLIQRSEVPVTDVERRVNINESWIDRSWWRVSPSLLEKGLYVIANMPRPMSDNFELIKPVADFVFGKEVTEDIILRE